MNLSAEFRNIASGRFVQIHTLEQNRLYSVVFARRLETQYGSTVLLTLQAQPDCNIKINLPKRYADVVDDDHIDEINQGGVQYKLIYIGKAGTYGSVVPDRQKNNKNF